MKAQYIIVSESYALDHQTGRVSTFHLIDQLHVTSTPFLIPSISLVMLLIKESADRVDEQFEVSISVNNKQILNSLQNANFGTETVNRNFLSIQGLLVPEAGNLKFSARHKGQEIGFWHVPVEGIAIESVQQVVPARPKRRKPAKADTNLDSSDPEVQPAATRRTR